MATHDSSRLVSSDQLCTVVDWLQATPQDCHRLDVFEKEGGLQHILQQLGTHPTDGLLVDPKTNSHLGQSQTLKRTFVTLIVQFPLQICFHALPLLLCLLCWGMCGCSLVHLVGVLHTGVIFFIEMQTFIHSSNSACSRYPHSKGVVMRKGQEQSIDWEDLVVGDLLKVDLHHTLCVDGILVHGTECIVDETEYDSESTAKLKLPYKEWVNVIRDTAKKAKKQKDIRIPSPAILAKSVICRGSGWLLVTSLKDCTKLERTRRKLGFYLEECLPTTRLIKKVSDTLIVWKIGLSIIIGMGCLVIGKHRLSIYNSGQKSWSLEETQEVLKLLAF